MYNLLLSYDYFHSNVAAHNILATVVYVLTDKLLLSYAKTGFCGCESVQGLTIQQKCRIFVSLILKCYEKLLGLQRPACEGSRLCLWTW